MHLEEDVTDNSLWLIVLVIVEIREIAFVKDDFCAWTIRERNVIF